MIRDYLIDKTLLEQLLDYDPKTGTLIWKVRDESFFFNSTDCALWNSRYAGKAAGGIDKRGAITLKIFDKSLSAPRVIWILTYGNKPNGRVKYKNSIKTDLRIDNLIFT
jgi:hypothetical protein